MAGRFGALLEARLRCADMSHRMNWPVRLTGRGGFAIAALLMLTGCASSGAVPQPFPAPRGSTPAPATPSPPAPPGAPGAHADGYALSSTALSFQGAPYRNGGSAPDGFDCSGFVQYVFSVHGLTVPRETREQFRIGRSVKPDDLAPGDLVFFSTTAPGASHVGIMVGGDQFVHAPSSRGVVRVERLSAEYWRRRYIGARRAD
jgi:cell wall-associated NlpC family hydrolase